MKEHSELFKQNMAMVYPIIILFGIYVTVNGHITPGGGFQGGTILAAAFMVHYLATFSTNIKLVILNRLEKILYLSLLLLSVTVVFYLNGLMPPSLKSWYLLTMNMLISLKVCSGLTVVFFRFVLFESR